MNEADSAQDIVADQKIASSWFAPNKKTLAAGIAAALIVCMGMGACIWNQKLGGHGTAAGGTYAAYTDVSRVNIETSIPLDSGCCIEFKITGDSLRLIYDLSLQNIESISVEQNDTQKKMNQSMFYRAYVSGLGWMAWAYEGDTVGCENLGRTIEKLEVMLIPHTHSTNEPTLPARESITLEPSANISYSTTKDYVTDALCPGIVETYRNKPFTETVPELIQYPELPWGCESVAAVIALQSYGFNIQKTDIATYYLTYSSEDYIHAYVGNPFHASGLGRCMPPAIVDAINRYLADAETPLQAQDITGVSFDELCTYIDEGYPVIVWSTQYERYPSNLEENGQYVNYTGEHVLVMYDYDNEQEVVYVSDPQLGLTQRNLKTFVECFNITGKMAVVIA